jgi:biotin carboxyl carrier protein
MRTYRVNIGGKIYVVEIEPSVVMPIHVRVNGEPFAVEVEWQGDSPRDTVSPAIRPRRREELAVSPQIVAPTKPTVPSPGHATSVATEGEEARAILAPMPGTILEVLVRAGDEVRRGQEVCVLDAMKMRNSIKAPRQARIAEVKVAPGQTVAFGDTLMRLE